MPTIHRFFFGDIATLVAICDDINHLECYVMIY